MTIPTWAFFALSFGAGCFVGATALAALAIWSDYLDRKVGRK